MPFESIFYREYLNHELQKRQHRNSRYSLRSFARDLNMTASCLSEVMNGKKGISQKRASSVAALLNLRRKEFSLFILSAKAAHSRKKADRYSALTEIKKLSAENVTFKKLTTTDFNFISSWYFQAILEVIELEDFDNSPEWIAKKLNLPVSLIKHAIQKLTDLNLLTVEKGIIKASYDESETDFDIPSDSIKQYHYEMLMMARTALYDQDVTSREFSNMTLAFDTSKLPEAKKFVRDFQRQFAEKFYSKKSAKNSVYQLSMQLFRLDKPGKTT